MRNVLRCAVVAVLSLVGPSSVSAYQDPPAVARENGFTRLVLNENFTDGSGIDPVWKKQNRRENNGRIRPYYEPDAVGIQSGSSPRLVISAYNQYRRNRSSGEIERWIAGAMDTRPRLDETPPHTGLEHTYGYIEARILFRTQPGQNNAFWLNTRWNKSDNWRGRGEEATKNLPAINEYDRDFNTNFGNEVDIIECLKHHTPMNPQFIGLCGPRLQGNKIDASRCLISNIHWGGGPNSNPKHGSIGQHVKIPDNMPDLVGNYHTYGLLWRRDRYEFYVDGQKLWDTGEQSEVVSQRPAFLILGTGVDDSEFVGTPPSGGYGTKPNTQARMEVDWVRWWSNTTVREPAAQ